MKLLRLILLILFVYGIGHAWFVARAGFSLKRIVFSPLSDSYDEEKEKKALPYLDQPYYYLGKGRQCYAFTGADGKTVLKIPRFDRYRLPLLLKAFNFEFLEPYKTASIKDRTSRLAFILESFQIAENTLSKQTGLIYSHTQRTKTLPKKFVIYDSLGRPFKLDLNQTVFALQEKQPLLIPQFLKELKAGNREKAKEILTGLVDLIESRAKLGLFNKDARFIKNFSWNEGKTFQIDIGSFYRDPLVRDQEVLSRSFYQGAWPICEWLIKIDPEMASLVENRLNQCSSSD